MNAICNSFIVDVIPRVIKCSFAVYMTKKRKITVKFYFYSSGKKFGNGCSEFVQAGHHEFF